MGSGIAEATARAGYPTLVFDPNPSVIQSAEKNIETGLQKLVEKEKIAAGEKSSTLANLRFTTNIDDCKGDLVIEAIIEDLVIKQQLFLQLANLNSRQTILASNTSSLSVSAIAEPLPYRERVIGLHFFNPAPVMKMVEIIETGWSSPDTTHTATSFIESLNKVPVLCKDFPGFIVNRVARHYYLESLRLAEDGVADLETIDRVLESAGFKMGPFRLMDLIGNDVNLAVSRSMYEAFGKAERFKPSILQENKVSEGKLGRKTGKGFYNY